MNVPGMENINELENILMDMVRRRLEREGSVPTLTPSEMKAAEILTDIFRIKADISMCGPLVIPREKQDEAVKAWHESAWSETALIHETEEPETWPDVMESKYYIVKALEDVLKMTRAGENIEELIYESEHEIVKIRFRNGYTKMVSVDCDSGIATIRDVVNAL